MSSIVRNEFAAAVNGVNGRFHNVISGKLSNNGWKEGTFANQKWVSERRAVAGYRQGAMLQVELSFDDNCKNGANTFYITGEVFEPLRRDCVACGTLHEDIAQVFPELAHLIKWHGCSTDGPTHYIANTLYMAGDADCSGKRKGEPTSFDSGMTFGNSPITVKVKRKFLEWLKAAEDFNSKALKTNPDYVHFEPVAVEHVVDSTGYKYADKYTFKGFECKWYECPFDNYTESAEFSLAMKLPHFYVKVPTAWSEGKEREFDKARDAAIWPDATDEQLSLPKAELKALLEARLPALLADFESDIKAIGFLWSDN
jgi:hypothetical protein